jgi:S-(hydroxymethyl)glutathione dehydrogenase/alcohol dehydrogenase
MKAAVLYETKQPLRVDDVDLEAPRAGEVLVEVKASGICHSDYSVTTALVTMPLPMVLGHEGAGIVRALGDGVATLQVGDHVVLSYAPDCGRCRFCLLGRPTLCERARFTFGKGTLPDGSTRFSREGEPLHHFLGLGCLAERVVVPETACIPIPREVPFESACLVGCAVLTGVGAALNTAQVAPGSSAVVIGCGGVGLNVIQGCRIAGAARIIAVDVNAAKLEYARRFGATDFIDASSEEPVKKIRALTGFGSDYAFEVIGLAKTIEQAFACTRPAGTTVVVGAGARDDLVKIPASSFFLTEKVLKGSSYGSCRPRFDVPRMLDLYRSGALKLDELVSRTYPLAEVNQALSALEQGEVARGVVVMGGS